MGGDETLVPVDIIRRIARGTLTPSQAVAECQNASLSEAAVINRAIRALVSGAKGYRDRAQYGQMCAAIIVGVASFGSAFLSRAERERVFIAPLGEHRFGSSLTDFISRLEQDANPLFDPLKQRWDTYLRLHQLRASALISFPGAVSALRERPFKFGRTLVALTNAAFLRSHFGFKGAPACDLALSRFSSAEDVAEAVSTVIALANAERPLESLDFTFPIHGLHLDERLGELLNYGHAYAVVSEAEKLISTLGYTLSCLRHDGPTVFALFPPTEDIEYALRLGFVRTEIGHRSSQLHVARRIEDAPISIVDAVQSMLPAWESRLAEIRSPDTEFRRLRLLIPLAPEFYEQLGRFRFYEDALSDERLLQELELPVQASNGRPWQLVQELDLPTFMRAWRLLRFWNVMDIALLMKHQDDAVLVGNSLTRVSSVEAHQQLLAAFGLSPAESAAFVRLTHLDVNAPGHVDLQYRPFLVVNESEAIIAGARKRTSREVIHPPALVAVANVIPNVQRAHSIRGAANAEALVTATAENLKTIAQHVRTNVAVKRGQVRTDIDVIAFTGNTLYMFECKHSVPPTGAHELRDLWQDVQKGVEQLAMAAEFLAEKLPDYLAGWFPGTRRGTARDVTLKPCVLCSHRVFSGMTIKGVPIRDYASLSLTLGDATVHMGRSDATGAARVRPCRLRTGERPTMSDLNNYLSSDAVFFKMFRPGMHRYTQIDRLTESLILARGSFVYQVSEDSWRETLEAIGAVPLDEETIRIGPARPEP
jgi:hypothetical protein